MKRITTILIVVTVLVLSLTACDSYKVPGSVQDFFAGQTWQDLIAYFFAFLFGVFPTFNGFQWVKDKLGLSGQSAHWAVMGFSILLTSLAMFVTGVFNKSVFEVTFSNILELGIFVYTGSQVAYQRFKQVSG